MNTSRDIIEVGGIQVEVIRKPIKNLHLSVHPPEGHVRVSAPLRVDDEAVRLAVISRLRWIRRHQKTLADHPRESQREMVSGESHYFMGRRYRLRVLEHDGPRSIGRKGNSELVMRVRPGTGRDKREQLLNDWYRRYMKALVPDLIAEWQPIIGVCVAQWGIKKMKTRWGSCNVRDRRVWLNLELAKKPPLASNTSWSTRWCICWNAATAIGSERLWMCSYRNGGCTGMN